MTVIISPDAFRPPVLGNGPVTKAVTLSAATFPVFTVTGDVLITGLWLKVTTSITTDGGTVAMNTVPTAGNTVTLVVASNLGTTDSVAGTIVGLDLASPSFFRGGRVDLCAAVSAGTINLIGASGVNGAVTVNVTWVPLTDGSTLVAAA